MEFKLHSEYQPTGDQPQAIEALEKASGKATNSRHYWGLRGLARRLPWQM